MLKKIYNSSIVNSWFNNFVIILNSLIAIPIVITKLNINEINIWFLFSSVVGISQGIMFSFNSTFVRFITYSYAGIKFAEIKNIKKTNSSSNYNFDKIEFSSLLILIKKIYKFATLLFVITLLIVGYFILRGPIGYLENSKIAWWAWIIIIFTSSLTFSLGFSQVFLEGLNKIALVQRTQGIANLIGLTLIIGVLFFKPTLIAIISVYQLISLSTAILIYTIAVTKFPEFSTKKSINSYDKNLIKIIFESAWKSGFTTIIANIMKNITPLFISQFYPPSQSAVFLFTKRIFDIIEKFTSSVYDSRVPVVAKFRGVGDFKSLLPYLKKTQVISYIVFLVSYLAFILLGMQLLGLIKSNVSFSPSGTIILFSTATFLSRWTGMSLSISNQANHIIEHKNAFIVIVSFLAFLFIFKNKFGLNTFILAQIFSLLLTIPLIIKNVYKTLFTSFYDYEKKIVFPFFLILLIINTVYYLYTV